MDLSKLPRLSDTENPPSAPSPAAAPQEEKIPVDLMVPKNDFAIGPEVWVSLIVGLLLIGISRHFPAYVFDQMTGRTFHTGVIFTSDNSEVPYPQLEGFVMITDAAVFAFGVALLCDAILRASCVVLGAMARRLALTLALFLTLCATLFNAFVAIKLLQADVMPLISGLAVAFGGYMAFEQIRAIRLSR